MGSVPRRTDEVTHEWVDRALRESGTLTGDARVAAVHAEVLPAGVGFMGEVATVTCTYEGKGSHPPEVMIAKFPTDDPDIRAMMKPTRVFEREHSFYRDLAAVTPLRTPDCYHVTCDPDGDEFVLLMQDMSHLTLGDQAAGATPAQAEAALRGLAAHHARFWHGAGLAEAEYVPVINSPINKVGKEIYEQSLPGFMQVFAPAIEPWMEEPAARFTANVHQMLDRLAAMPTTLVHFDYRSDNLFFDDGGDVVAIDFQAISQGGGAADVGYFMSQNLAVADRREHEDRLLRTYHDALEVAGVDDYSLEQLRDDYRVGIMYGWIIPVFAVGSLESSSERAMNLWTEVLARVQAAIADVDGTALLTE
ncbi:MAG: ecdysteroid 22-kinase family protein [Acidimicrobiia bacterium]|nr:ecdysteroid 22-kinase family protein [Acidimicrobiia bacterium]